jgi:hypothetical protein
MTLADKLREVKRQLERPHYTGGPCDVTCPACSALATLPDPEEVATLEKMSAEEYDKLAARIKTAIDAGHNDNCIFCGLKDKALGEEEK